MKFPTFSWLDGPHFLPILHEIVWNLFTYREYFKILDTRGHVFLKQFGSVCSQTSLLLFLNWDIFSTPSKTWNSLHFPDFSPISQPFLTLSANSLRFQGLKKYLISDFLKIFPWEPCFDVNNLTSFWKVMLFSVRW